MSAWYTWIKLVHVFSVVLWTASALGAFWYVVIARWQLSRQPDDPELQRRDRWVRAQFLVAVLLEHVAFVVAVPSGLMLMSILEAGSIPWMQAKLAIVLGVFLPMEVFDIWLSHLALPRAMRGDDRAWERRLVRWHDRFLYGGGTLICVLIAIVFWLIIVRPS
ncbi:MAG: hypothetical protein QGG40_12720 [Myxococcota bacterium]|nr:hypothetical protein [Myxococcota bacterium]